MRPNQLIESKKTSRVSKSLRPTIAVSVKALDAAQTGSNKQKALRLVCRAMIRLYLQDNGKPEHGKGLGIL